MGHSYHRYETLSLERVSDLYVAFANTPDGKHQPHVTDEYVLRLSSFKVKTYLDKGFVCVSCGREGSYFAAEAHTNVLKNRQRNKAHLNLYGIDPISGCEFMMTVDHIIPKSLGGTNTRKNLDPMCSRCNLKKGNDPDWVFIDKRKIQ